MGFGDEILASGLAKNTPKGKRAAFGDGKRIIWGPWSEEIFRHNPRIAKPGSEGSPDLYYIDHYKGHRQYNRLDKDRGRWIWNYDWRAVPGEIFFDQAENDFRNRLVGGFIYVEPNVPWHKSVSVNKNWGLQNYQAVVDRLVKDGFDVVQSRHGRERLKGVRVVRTPTFRDALSVMSRARAALVPEGGLHHGAAALEVPAVVLFGGFIPPAVVGYVGHRNLTGGADEACGSLNRCQHCLDAMNKISIEEVHQATVGFMCDEH
jgi:ADP-heptose:LPS heptosyltransferase